MLPQDLHVTTNCDLQQWRDMVNKGRSALVRIWTFFIGGTPPMELSQSKRAIIYRKTSTTYRKSTYGT
jgi:hypothetical protein